MLYYALIFLIVGLVAGVSAWLGWPLWPRKLPGFSSWLE
jgi:hypothetical protein